MTSSDRHPIRRTTAQALICVSCLLDEEPVRTRHGALLAEILAAAKKTETLSDAFAPATPFGLPAPVQPQQGLSLTCSVPGAK
ncbi:MAG TPA: hypothetical protein VIL69_21395 [Roseomonas sp.]|jgi:hypothetical protein